MIFNSYKINIERETDYIYCALYPSDDAPDQDAFWEYRDGSHRDYIEESGGPEYGGFDSEGVYYID